MRKKNENFNESQKPQLNTGVIRTEQDADDKGDQRELLIDFFRKVSKVRLEDKGNMYTVTKVVDDYLKDN